MELESHTRSPAYRMFAPVGRIVTRGPHVDPGSDLSLRAELDAYRRSATDMRFLERVLASGKHPEIVWDADAIRRSVDDLSTDAHAGPAARLLIAQVYARSSDADVRLACRRALQVFKNASADATTQPIAAPGQ